MNPVVTARVPEGVRTRGVDILNEIGSSTSELINAAFDYVIKERALPKPRTHQEGGIQPHVITQEQVAQAIAFMDSIRVATPREWEHAPFEELFDDAMEERHAHLR